MKISMISKLVCWFQELEFPEFAAKEGEYIKGGLTNALHDIPKNQRAKLSTKLATITNDALHR